MNQPSGRVTDQLLRAVHDRDLQAVLACLLPEGSWQNVPEAPIHGHAGLRNLSAQILSRSTEVSWDVRSASYAPTQARLERVDRFVIDGRERVAYCNGVFEIDATSGLLAEVRDYVDLAAWRRQLADVRWRPPRSAPTGGNDHDHRLWLHGAPGVTGGAALGGA